MQYDDWEFEEEGTYTVLADWRECRSNANYGGSLKEAITYEKSAIMPETITHIYRRVFEKLAPPNQFDEKLYRKAQQQIIATREKIIQMQACLLELDAHPDIVMGEDTRRAIYEDYIMFGRCLAELSRAQGNLARTRPRGLVLL